jgi:hypothetical protein
LVVLAASKTKIPRSLGMTRFLIVTRLFIAALRCSSRKRQQRDVARLLDGRGQPVLVRRAYPSQPPGHDLAALRDELSEQSVVFVIDVGDLLSAELANFLAPEKLASTFARRTTGPRSPASTASESWSVSPGTRSVARWSRWPFTYRRCCFCLVSHKSPSKIIKPSLEFPLSEVLRQALLRLSAQVARLPSSSRRAAS